MRKPKINEVWLDKKLNKKFFIYNKIINCEYEIYKPFDVLYENNQTRYLETKYILENCEYLGKCKISFGQLFEIKGKK